ncbi:ABC transporter substrate-binding protein [Pelagibacterales bacterium SAG-MED39]|nr:ABC transporter substrate-binding protein [Pelagibacterales bacterium SAG-MED39]
MNKNLKKILISIIIFTSICVSNVFAEIKVGIILGFTGPISSFTPAMAKSAELAFIEASESDLLLSGKTISSIRIDSTCIDTSSAIKAANNIVSQNVVAVIGASCPNIAQAIATEVTIPNKIIMVSPSSTSPSLKDLVDSGFFFRTSPSDIRSAQILADFTKDKNIKSLAITYVDNSYEENLSKAFKAALEAYNIKVTKNSPHVSGKKDYSSEVAKLATSGGDALAIISYPDRGGKEIIQASLDSGTFNKFIFFDGMIDNSLTDEFSEKLNESFGILSGSKKKGARIFADLINKNGINSGPYIGESYDAAALIVLAMQSGNSTSSESIVKNILDVANSPGTKIYPGELKKGLDLIIKGKKINYEGVTNVEFSKDGKIKGSFLEQVIKNGKFKSQQQR